MNNLFKLLTIAILILSCQDNEYIFYPDLDEDYRRILKISENEFKTNLRNEYENRNDYINLQKYMMSIVEKGSTILEPSNKLKNHIKRGNIVRDIWNDDKTVNLNGKFYNCIKKSKSKFLKEYCDRIENVGDIAPSAIAQGMLKYIDENGKNEYIFPIATVNFYLITLN